MKIVLGAGKEIDLGADAYIDFGFGTIKGPNISFNSDAASGEGKEVVFYANSGYLQAQFPPVTIRNKQDGEVLLRFIRDDYIPNADPFQWCAGVDSSQAGGHLHYIIFRDSSPDAIPFMIVEDGSIGLGLPALPNHGTHPSARLEVRQRPGGTDNIINICDSAGNLIFGVDNNGPRTAAGPLTSGSSGGVDNTAYSVTTVTPFNQTGSALGGGEVATWRHKQLGKTVLASVVVSIPNNGGSAGGICVPLPVAKRADWYGVFACREDNVTGKMCQGFMRPGEAYMIIHQYDDGYPVGSGHLLFGSGSYEAA